MNILNSTIGLAARDAAVFNPRPIGYFTCTNMYTLESKFDHYYTRADQLIDREARSILTLSPHNQLTLNQDFLEPSDLTTNYEEGAPMPDFPLNPGERGSKSPNIPFLQKSQVPSLLITLDREEPDPNPGQTAKSNTCVGPNLREASILSGFEEHFAMFDINKFSNPTSTFDADSYLRNVGKYPPSTSTQPVLKHPGISTKRDIS